MSRYAIAITNAENGLMASGHSADAVSVAHSRQTIAYGEFRAVDQQLEHQTHGRHAADPLMSVLIAAALMAAAGMGARHALGANKRGALAVNWPSNCSSSNKESGQFRDVPTK